MSTPLVNAQAWPSGVTLTWSSLSGLWTYVRVGRDGLERTELVPVPALAAPSAVSAVLPALMDGRHGLLPRSQEQWEHAEALLSWVESAAVYGDDKYDAAYQAAEEEEDHFQRWQEQLEAPEAAAGQQGSGLPEESGAREQEEARRRFVTTVMLAAQAEAGPELSHLPHPEMFGVLCDFFTRAIVFPGQFGFPSGSAADDAQLHTSDPARALSRLLLEHLTHHGLDLVEADDRAPAGLIEGDAGPRRLAARGAEDTGAPPELVDQVLAVCERHYAAVTGTNCEQWDGESAREVVGIALRTVRTAERETYPQTLDAYLREHRARLERLWQRYGPGGLFAGEVVLIDLPGCFVLCERIDEAPLWLDGVWSQEGQEETALKRLRDSWLYDTGKKGGR